MLWMPRTAVGERYRHRRGGRRLSGIMLHDARQAAQTHVRRFHLGFGLASSVAMPHPRRSVEHAVVCCSPSSQRLKVHLTFV